MPPMPSIAGMLSSIGPTCVSHRLRAQRQRALEGVPRVDDAERHRAGATGRALRERRGEGVRLGVDDEVDVALAVERHVLASDASRPRRSPSSRTARRAPPARMARTRRTRSRRCPSDCRRRLTAGGASCGNGPMAFSCRLLTSCPRKRASSTPQRLRYINGAPGYWVPAFAGTTAEGYADNRAKSLQTAHRET